MWICLISTSFAGAPNASTIVKGLVQLATGLQAASSTGTGSTGAFLAIPALLATDTPSVPQTVSASHAVFTDLTGYIKQGWLNLSANWTFQAAVSMAASASHLLTLNTVPYAFPSSQGISGSLLKDDGAGNLSWGNPTRYAYNLGTISTTTTSNFLTAYATSTLATFPSGTLASSTVITINTYGTCADSGSTSGSCTVNISNQAGNVLATLGVASLGSSASHTWNNQIILINGNGSINFLNTGVETTGGPNDSSGSTSINLATATGLYVVLQTTSSAAGGVGQITASSLVISP